MEQTIGGYTVVSNVPFDVQYIAGDGTPRSDRITRGGIYRFSNVNSFSATQEFSTDAN
jgi:hypothetical protein